VSSCCERTRPFSLLFRDRRAARFLSPRLPQRLRPLLAECFFFEQGMTLLSPRDRVLTSTVPRNPDPFPPLPSYCTRPEPSFSLFSARRRVLYFPCATARGADLLLSFFFSSLSCQAKSSLPTSHSCRLEMAPRFPLEDGRRVGPSLLFLRGSGDGAPFG